MVNIWKILNVTFGDERNAPREGDKALVGVLNVEKAASWLDIVFKYFNNFKLYLILVFWLECSMLKRLPQNWGEQGIEMEMHISVAITSFFTVKCQLVLIHL